MAEKEKKKGTGDLDRTKGGPGLGGSREAIERSGPEEGGMAGGDTGPTGEKSDPEKEISASGGEVGAPDEPKEEM